MKSSIKKKFFLVFIIILLISEISLLFFSNLFLDDIIISANKILIKNVFEDNKAYFEQSQVKNEDLKYIASKNDIGIVVYDEGTISACSSFFLCQDDSTQLPTYITNYFPYVSENQYYARIIHLRTLDINQLVYMYNMGDGRYVIMDKSLHSIEELNQIMNGFIQVLGIVVFFIGTFVIIILGNKTTRPIIKISKYANDLAHLKFDEELKIKNKDEIGQLASNMNLISSRLDKALTELNERNQSLKEDLELEKEMDRKRVKFFSTVSHEFKTPITIIQGYAEGMKHRVVKSQEELDEYCDVIIDESKKMGRFVNDLLNLSLYESGNFMLQKADFDVVSLIEEVKNKFNESIKDKNVQFHLYGIPKCIIYADKYRVEQIINNLLSNAIKHVDENGEVKITVTTKDQLVFIKFYNNGDKIDEKDIHNIWNLFYKLENNNKNRIGTGIGLAIVKSIVELHQGSYGAKNVEDGVEFNIELPMK